MFNKGSKDFITRSVYVHHIELAQVLIPDGKRHIEHCDFVDKGYCYTKRFCRMISGLCGHMTISTVVKHFGIRWQTVKNIDEAYPQETLPSLNPEKLTNLKYLRVDEVAKAKGHCFDYTKITYGHKKYRLPLS